MSVSQVIPLEKRRIDEYLGFEILSGHDETFTAVPKFGDRRVAILSAASKPLLRKRIWQWWHSPEVWSN